MKFRCGQKVVCINGFRTQLIEGETYTIKAYNNLWRELRVVLEEMPFDTCLWYETRFIDATDLKVSERKTIMNSRMTLPTDSAERKNYPLHRGCLSYFPAALAGVAHISKLGNDKHNPGEELHHARGKSMDHEDCVIRHLTDVSDLLAAYNRGDTTVTAESILNEANQMAWRVLAFSQELHEKFGAPLAPGAKK